jgi:TonB family protein
VSVARLRIRIVTAPAGGFSPLHKFLLFSFLVHLGLTVVLVLIPELRRGPRFPHDATVVELVGALPGARPEPAVAAPAPRPQPPAPKPPKKEAVTVQNQEPEPAPEKKPEPKATEPAEDDNPPPSPAPTAPPVEDEQATASGDVAGSAATGASVSALEIGGAAFAWYRSSVANALYGHWRRPVISGLVEPIEVRVAFEIMRDGNVRGLRVEESSGVPSLDRSALRAVSDATPLPALPSALSEPYLPASIVFRLYPEGY